jgi:hypothetical protein
MANIYQGEAEFIASDGQVWRLVLDFYAYAVACDAMGVDLDELFRRISPDVDGAGVVIRSPRPLDLGHLLYGGLQRHHGGLPLRDAVNLLAEGDVVMTALAKAVEGSVTPPEKRSSAEGKDEGGTGTKPKSHGQKKA